MRGFPSPAGQSEVRGGVDTRQTGISTMPSTKGFSTLLLDIVVWHRRLHGITVTFSPSRHTSSSLVALSAARSDCYERSKAIRRWSMGKVILKMFGAAMRSQSRP